MQDKIQQAMMALKLLEMLRGPQQQQQEMGMRQQAQGMQQQELAMRQQMMQQRAQQEQQRQQQMQQMGVLKALTSISRDPMTGGADPLMVLEYLRSIGVQVPQAPPQAMTPEQQFRQLSLSQR